jgi:hypothetical protein
LLPELHSQLTTPEPRPQERFRRRGLLPHARCPLCELLRDCDMIPPPPVHGAGNAPNGAGLMPRPHRSAPPTPGRGMRRAPHPASPAPRTGGDDDGQVAFVPTPGGTPRYNPTS